MPQKHMYLAGTLGYWCWHAGQRNDEPSPDPPDLAHFFTQKRWKTRKHSPVVQLHVATLCLIVSVQIMHS